MDTNCSDLIVWRENGLRYKWTGVLFTGEHGCRHFTQYTQVDMARYKEVMKSRDSSVYAPVTS